MLNGRCRYRVQIFHPKILVPSSEEKLSLYDVTKTSLQHYAPPPPLGAAPKNSWRKKERENLQLTLDDALW
jgi:hypothetical protein